MLTSHPGRVGTLLIIPVQGSIGAIGFTCEVPFEFRLVRDGKPTELPMAVAALAGWQTYVPRTSPPCHSTLYPVAGGTSGLNTKGLAIETKGLLTGHPYTLFINTRY